MRRIMLYCLVVVVATLTPSTLLFSGAPQNFGSREGIFRHFLSSSAERFGTDVPTLVIEPATEHTDTTLTSRLSFLDERQPLKMRVPSSLILEGTDANFEHVIAKAFCILWIEGLDVPLEGRFGPQPEEACALSEIGLESYTASVVAFAARNDGYADLGASSYDEAFALVKSRLGPYAQSVDEGFISEATLRELTILLIEEHEKRTGVSYRGTVPVVVWTAELPPSQSGRYNSESRIISLDTSYRYCDIRALLENIAVPLDYDMSRSCDPHELRNTLSHELAHYLTHLMVEEMPDSWLYESFKIGRPGNLSGVDTAFIEEGIAGYFGRLFDAKKTAFRVRAEHISIPPRYVFHHESPEAVDFIYDTGSDFVGSIIDGNVVAGLQWILTHELKMRFLGTTIDRRTLTRYLERAERDLN